MGDLFHNITYPADFKLGTSQVSKLMMGTVQIWPRVAIGFADIKIYNWFAIAGTGTKSIAASGWRVPTIADWATLSTNLGGDTVSGGKLKEAGTTHWSTPNTGADNSSEFNGVPAGMRYQDGSFVNTGGVYYAWASDLDEDTYGNVLGKALSYIYDDLIPSTNHKVCGLPVRLVRESTDLTNGQKGTYTANDGTTHNTICIGTTNKQEWLSQDLFETKLRDGTIIPQKQSAHDWTGLITPAWCYYNEGETAIDALHASFTSGTTYWVFAFANGHYCFEYLSDYGPDLDAHITVFILDYPGATLYTALLYDNITDGIFSGTLPVVENQYYVVFQLCEHFIAIVTTAAISNIANTKATSGGIITFDGNLSITSRGVCWSTFQNPTIADSKTVDGSGAGSFVSSITGLTAGTTYYIRSYATNSKGTSYGDEVSFLTSNLKIGDAYQGGIIAYIDEAGEHGFIAAPYDQSSGIRWHNGSNITTGATNLAIGAGSGNTNTIVAAQGTGSYAAKLCYDLSLNGYTDWYLPSAWELSQLMEYKDIIGSFDITQGIWYWSSTEHDEGTAFYCSPLSSIPSVNPKVNIGLVRAIRSF